MLMEQLLELAQKRVAAPMFANRLSLITLVRTDPCATDEEKAGVMDIIENGISVPEKGGRPDVPKIVSFEDAATILGVKNKRSVQNLMHKGIVQGFYSGEKKRRATGIVGMSLMKAVAAREKESV